MGRLKQKLKALEKPATAGEDENAEDEDDKDDEEVEKETCLSTELQPDRWRDSLVLPRPSTPRHCRVLCHFATTNSAISSLGIRSIHITPTCA